LEIVLATTIDAADEDQGPGIVAIAGFIPQHRSVVIIVACGGHETKRVARAGLLAEIVSCSVNREDVEQHHLTRSQLDVHGVAFIHFTVVDRDAEDQVVAILPDVASDLLSACDPGRKRKQAFARRLSNTAIQTDVVASGLTGVWAASRCHGVAGPASARLWKMPVPQRMMSGPTICSTMSTMWGCVAISSQPGVDFSPDFPHQMSRPITLIIVNLAVDDCAKHWLAHNKLPQYIDISAYLSDQAFARASA
jgi:hypothetical protein